MVDTPPSNGGTAAANGATPADDVQAPVTIPPSPEAVTPAVSSPRFQPAGIYERFSPPPLYDRRDMEEIEERIGTVTSDLNQMRNRYRPYYYTYLFASAIGLVFLLFGKALITLVLPDITAASIRYVPAISLAVTAFALIGLFVFFLANLSRRSSLQAELDQLLARQKTIQMLAEYGVARKSVARAGKKSSQEKVAPPSYFDSLVKINVDNLAEYYALVKTHTNNSFLISASTGVVGFVLILIGLLVGFVNSANSQSISYISAGAGIVTEFIASIFFYLYNRTVRQMKDYHDSLLSVQNILLSFKIVGDTQDDVEKVKMVGQMLEYLVGQRHLIPSGLKEQAQKN
jgi:hypothetical protein